MPGAHKLLTLALLSPRQGVVTWARGWMIGSWVFRNTLSATLLRGWCGAVARVCDRENVPLPHALAALSPLVPAACPLPTAAHVLSAAADPAHTRARSLWFLSMFTWPSLSLDARETARIWAESGLLRFALRGVELAARYVGAVPIESLDCGVIYYCCNTIAHHCSALRPESGAAT